MQRNPQKYLYDMKDSCGFLLEFVSGRTLEEFKSDRGFRSAIERELLIIGEAMFQLNKFDPSLAEKITEHTRIISFRHILVHGYDVLEADVIWGVVQNKLTQLSTELDGLIET